MRARRTGHSSACRTALKVFLALQLGVRAVEDDAGFVNDEELVTLTQPSNPGGDLYYAACLVETWRMAATRTETVIGGLADLPCDVSPEQRSTPNGPYLSDGVGDIRWRKAACKEHGELLASTSSALTAQSCRRPVPPRFWRRRVWSTRVEQESLNVGTVDRIISSAARLST
jgi:hypothetical protein